MMERTKKLPSVARKKRMFASIVVVAPAFLSVEGFGSIATKLNFHHHQTVVLSTSFHRNRPIFHPRIEEDTMRLAMSPRSDFETIGAARGDEKESSDNGDDNEDRSSNNNIGFHQQIKQADPEWYQEYVSGLLGEDYCSDRWPKVDLSVVPEQTGGGTENEDKAATITSKISEAVPEEKLLPKPTATEEKVGDEKTINRIEDEDDGEIDFESPQAIETIIKEDIGNSLPNDASEDEEGKTGDKIVAKDLIPEVEDAKEQEDDSQKGEKNDKELASQNIGSNKTVGEKGDTRALVYRNITGKTMACVPLANLLELGYAVSDLERIQAEFLSIVILDQRKCPSMGVPSQWKIRDPRAVAEITMVDSMDEASAAVTRINEEERNERDSISQRRSRQEARQLEIKTRTRGPSMTDEEMARNARRETNRRREVTNGDGRSRKPEDRRRGGREGRREMRRTSRGEPPEDDRSGRDRRRQRRREPLDRDGNPRKIYRVPRDDTSSRRMGSRDDPPDPDSPLWVNMDTFRDLLRKESEFRMKFIGDDWSDVIAEENDWRTDLYQSWLWTLTDGVGESFVPPSRYERARRNSQRRTPRERPQAPRRTMQDNRPRESPPRRRRPRRLRENDDDELPTPQKKPRPLREEQRGGQPPRSQQRTRRTEGEVPNPPAGEETTGAPTSAAQRRSRRRADRRRGPPPEDPTY